MLFHEKLIQRRRERGMTQEDLADRLSVSRQTVSKWENGECMPDADKFIRLSDVLEISLDELTGREVEAAPSVLPAPEVPQPGKKRRWTVLAAAACLLLCAACFCLGRYVFPKTVPAETGSAVTLPETLTVRDFVLQPGSDGTYAVCSFVSNVAVDGTVYLYPEGSFEDPVAAAAACSNGVYTSEGLRNGRYDRAVFVVSVNGEERSALLATDLEIFDEGWSWAHAEEDN